MGNEAIALGAVRAGVDLVCGYPGTPSTEVLETAAKHNDGSYYVEWSVNEKAAMEVAAGAAYAGARVLVTMKQVGLNVASDPLMSLAYVGVKGGMVILVADDPGPISSQTEQDTRVFAQYSKLPVFDPADPEEAYRMMADAYALSEAYCTPVFMRPTTRVCHGCSDIELLPKIERKKPEGFIKDTSRWVIFPRLAFANHQKIEARNEELAHTLSKSEYNILKKGSIRKGVAAGGVSRGYAAELLGDADVSFLEVGIPFPFPEDLAVEFLRSCDEVLVLEELSPYIERELTYLCGKHHINCTIRGKLTGDVQNAGENSAASIASQLEKFARIGAKCESAKPLDIEVPTLPVRPPVLCAGCPHRASFYAVKKAMKGREAVFCGDIGCYTLGNAKPLDMVDTCLCMGADVTVAQGLHRIEPDKVHFSFIGDSTFFASGITGVVNAVYNQTDIVLVVLDNSTTAMTGHQPHPGTAKTMMGNVSEKISIEAVLRAIGVSSIEVVDPGELTEAVEAVKRAADMTGVRVIIFRSPCIAVSKPTPAYIVKDNCIGCRMCIREIGCPAVSLVSAEDKKSPVTIDASLCYGCGLCAKVCPTGAIERGVK
ncbi:MAG: indolepyruvate ferredoxin oxidoreductase subunit alpha [Ruminococcaceae bacterium]|nr:indolepyruvate ferredoxin oxidoreductase subunit alpha [Oscillospiraceae bacterium]